MRLHTLAILGLALLSASLCANQQAESFKPFAIPNGHFEVGFPHKPYSFNNPIMKGSLIYASETLGRGYLATYQAFPDRESHMIANEFQDNPTSEDLKALSSLTVESFAKGFKGQITDSAYGAFKGRPATRAKVERPDMTSYVLCVLGNRRVYVLAVRLSPNDSDLSTIEKFFNSLKLGEPGG